MESTSLAVRVRPKKFKDMVNGKKLEIYTKKAIEENKFTSGLLIASPSGWGKTTAAKIIARMLNCEKQNSCGKCPSCLLMNQENHPDFTYFNTGKSGKVEDIRDLVENSKVMPQFNYKVINIDESHKLTGASQSVFLTELENVPKKTIYIFCTNEPYKMDYALRTRLLIFNLEEPDKDLLLKRLKIIYKKETQEEVNNKVTNFLKKILKLSESNVRLALMYLETAIQTKDLSKAIENLPKHPRTIATNILKLLMFSLSSKKNNSPYIGGIYKELSDNNLMEPRIVLSNLKILIKELLAFEATGKRSNLIIPILREERLNLNSEILAKIGKRLVEIEGILNSTGGLDEKDFILFNLISLAYE